MTNLSDGNIGAMNVITDLYSKRGDKLLNTLLKFDIKGSKIWILYKDICREDMSVFIKLLEVMNQFNIDFKLKFQWLVTDNPETYEERISFRDKLLNEHTREFDVWR